MTMQFELRPIFVTILRNRTGAVLVSLQIALTFAVLVNAVYIVEQRLDAMTKPLGVDLDNTFAFASAGFAQDFNFQATLDEDLAYLRSVPGVIAATATNSVPMVGVGGGAQSLATKPNDEQHGLVGRTFEVDEQGLTALGLRLVAGRDFRSTEILPSAQSVTASIPPQIIITQPLARALFPGGNALGKTVYDPADTTATIIGIVERLRDVPVAGQTDAEWTILLPRRPAGPLANNYIVRTQPGRRDAVMRVVEEHVLSSNPKRMVAWVRSLEQTVGRAYSTDRNMSIVLSTVTLLLLIVTAIGIFGLATFNVSTRTRQIGTRRALGARRIDIVRFFMLENWLISTAALVIGCPLALAAGYWLAKEYTLPRLNLVYLLVGVLALWVLGLAAVFQPARRAAAVSPAEATRTA
jgi:putative ABC transport system permease protein